MNPEIHSIVEDMKKRSKKEPIAESEIHTYLSIQMAHLLVLLAEESEKQSNKISEQTEKLIQYTRTIRYLTWALFFLGFIQIFMFIFKS
jgi:hypothetical protein